MCVLGWPGSQSSRDPRVSRMLDAEIGGHMALRLNEVL